MIFDLFYNLCLFLSVVILDIEYDKCAKLFANHYKGIFVIVIYVLAESFMSKFDFI